MGEEAARLRIVQITDVYTLRNFPSLKTLLKEKREEIGKLGGKTISMLTGDFLAPYLLSSFDKGWLTKRKVANFHSSKLKQRKLES